jgi:hypothetical protein
MNVLNTAIYSRLSTATALTSLLGGTRIYALQAPEGQALPYVCFSVQGGGDENQSPHRTKNWVVFVRAYASSNAQAGSIDALLDTALHNVPFTGVSGWTNFWMARETDLELVENDAAGVKTFMNGALYRVRFGQ